MSTLNRSSLQCAQQQAGCCELTAQRSYFIWTIGCQMNRADSRRVAAALEALGMRPAARVEEADLVVLNSCVVRQGAEDKVVGRLSSLRSLKARRPGAAVVLMGCLVGDIAALEKRFPHVDLFVRPSDVEALAAWAKATLARARNADLTAEPAENAERIGGVSAGSAFSAVSLVPTSEGAPVSAEVAAMMGCDRHCTYCLVRLRRGPGRSRPLDEVVAEAEALVAAGAREIVLLGQNIDAYGRDLPWDGLSCPPAVGQAPQPAHPWDGLSSPSGPARPSLEQLLRQVHGIPGLARLRFLTSHPADLQDEVVEAVAALPKACPHWELPVQAGDDGVLRRMGRGYTTQAYLALAKRIRARLPQASIATDIIVGFPGETDEQLERTLDLMRAVRFDAVHVACYSVRPGTPAARLADDVPAEEKERRRRAVEALQEEILTETNAALLGQEVEVLVEELHRGKWKGRTPANKLVFFAGTGDWRGRLARVRITKTGPWSLQGEALENEAEPQRIQR